LFRDIWFRLNRQECWTVGPYRPTRSRWPSKAFVTPSRWVVPASKTHFLELGLQADHPRLQPFLWITGMDTILSAYKENKFKNRLSKLLGPNTYILPADFDGRQPLYAVSEWAARMYKYRSWIAHGVEIPLRGQAMWLSMVALGNAACLARGDRLHVALH
jgi:hypothetical protein